MVFNMCRVEERETFGIEGWLKDPSVEGIIELKLSN